MNPIEQWRRSYASEGEHSASGSFLSKEDVTQRVINVLKKHDKVDPNKVTPDSHFVKDLGLDSLDSAEVVNEVEQEFVVEIPDEEAFKLQSVGDVVNYIVTSPVAK